MTTPLVVDRRQQRTDQNSSARIGLFGGTFDPVHFGHLRPAIELAEQYTLSTLYLLPNHRQVHRGPANATTEQRITMLQLAINNAESLAVDTREAMRDSASYTFDTLLEVRREHQDATLVFFMGLDAFALFDTWHDWEGILELANLVIVTRPDAQHSEFSRQLLVRQQANCGWQIVDGKSGVIEQADVTQIAISATDIRSRIAGSLSVQFLLPEVVREYIGRQRLYSTENE